jgi:hypothetical protein
LRGKERWKKYTQFRSHATAVLVEVFRRSNYKLRLASLLSARKKKDLLGAQRKNEDLLGGKGNRRISRTL